MKSLSGVNHPLMRMPEIIPSTKKWSLALHFFYFARIMSLNSCSKKLYNLAQS